MTQQNLALVAKVSTPTISRFENGEKDIQLSSALSILESLGLIDKRRLEFPELQPEYRTSKMVVEFKGINEANGKITCAISEECLQDQFNMDGQASLKIFLKNQDTIKQKAREIYLLSTRKEIIITTDDF